MQLDDCWDDAKLVPVYIYLRRGTRDHIPDSWIAAMSNMDTELVSRGYTLDG